VILFELPAKVLPYFVLAFRALVDAGIGPLRGSAILSSVEELPSGTPVYDGKRLGSRELSGRAFDFFLETSIIGKSQGETEVSRGQ
jgi:hypothetical protein